MPSAVRPRADVGRHTTGATSSASELSDEALLSGYGASDAAAAAEFVRRFQRRVFGLAFTVLGDRRARRRTSPRKRWPARGATRPSSTRGAAAWPRGCSRSRGTWRSTRRGYVARVAIEPDVLLGLMPPAPGRDPADVVSLHDDVDRLRAALDDAARGATSRRRARRNLGAERSRDRRAGRDPPRHREDADPHRAPPVAGRARRRPSGVKAISPR